MFDNEKPRVLIVCASRHGHTRKVAQHVANILAAQGLEPRRVAVDAAAGVDARDFDAVVVCGSIHMGRYDDRLVAWTHRHHTLLGQGPSALLSVSMASATDTPEARATAREYIDRFVEDTEWTPARCLAVAGALQYRKYGFLTRQMVRQIARQKGLSVDTGRDVEYTDWGELEEFARGIAAAVRNAHVVAG